MLSALMPGGTLPTPFQVRRPVPVASAQCKQALDKFLEDVNTELMAVLPHQRECRVFVSHRKCDVDIADCIAYLAANQCGYGYWLDIDDPALNYVNAPDVASPVKEMLIAAIIEIGLINSTHCIAAITWNSAGSKWIPYETSATLFSLLRELAGACHQTPVSLLNI